MSRNFSRVIHTAKRTLKNPCEECWEEIKKGEKYYIRTYQYMGRKTSHVKCNEDPLYDKKKSKTGVTN